MTASGERIDHWRGYTVPTPWIEIVESTIADPTPVEARRERYAGEPTAADAAVLGRVATTDQQFQQSLDYYQAARDLGSDDDYSYEMFDATYEAWRSESGLEWNDVVKAADAVLASDHATAYDVAVVAFDIDAVADDLDDPTVRNHYIEAGYKATANSESEKLQKWNGSLAWRHALHVEGDRDKAAHIRRDQYKEGWMDDPGQLNAYAWWCFEHRANLEEAEQLARRGIELAESGQLRGAIYDTVAEICNVRGSCEDAVEYIRLAIAADPENEYYQEQLARFEAILAEVN